MKTGLKIRGVFYLRFREKKTGKLLGVAKASNLVTNEGLRYLQDVAMLNAVEKNTEYRFLPLAADAVVAATDTYALHPGFTEFTAYDEATRQIWAGFADPLVAGVSTNEGFEAELTMTAEGVIGGLALAGGGDSLATKGDIAGGSTLFSAAVLDGGNKTFPVDFVVTIRYILTISRP